MNEVTTCKGGYLLANGVGGTIFIDRRLRELVLRERESGAGSRHMSKGLSIDPIERAALALLHHALIQPTRSEHNLEDAIDLDETDQELISVIMVGFNSLSWLKISLHELFAQTYPRLEIIFVDNGSEDGSSTWIAENYPQVKLYRLSKPQHLSKAINYGVEHAQGAFFLMLNPDTRLAINAISRLHERAIEEDGTAAVAAKLRFADLPSFLNGIGNRVGPFSWGMDNALGHLDLGQFDHWREVPSICFAAALIARDAWNAVGPLDDGFPLYYEDSEWSYRARALGFKLLAAPQAVVYHDFSAGYASSAENRLHPGKLRNVVYGRLRFATKLLDSRLLGRFLAFYLFEDIGMVLFSLLAFRFTRLSAILSGWYLFLRDFRDIRGLNRDLRKERVLGDRALLKMQYDMPPTLIRIGRPELTWDLVLRYYLPMILSDRTKQLPGLVMIDETSKNEWVRAGVKLEQAPWAVGLSRAWDLLRWEGMRGLLHRTWRQLQWRLSRL